MSSSDPSKALLMQHFRKDLTIMLSSMALHAADTHRATSEGAARKGRLKERCGLEPRTNFFPFKKSAKTSADLIRVRIRFENTRYLRSWISNSLNVTHKKLYRNIWARHHICYSQ
jgi:hypothetical protein